MRLPLLLLACACVLLVSCRGCPPPGPADAAPPSDAAPTSSAIVVNRTLASTTVYVSFGANSQVTGWPFCTPTGVGGQCSFVLAPSASQALPTGSQAANITIAFDAPVACGSSLGEFNFNIPGWSQDTTDISLVNGWNHDIEIDVSDASTVGPTEGPDANAGVYGVFPVACDICVARSMPSCGYDAGGCTAPGSCGCHVGTQYNPVPPCQESFPPGALVFVALVAH